MRARKTGMEVKITRRTGTFRIIVYVSLIVVFAAFGSGFAMTQYNVSDTSMISGSPLIVRGEVEYVNSRYEADEIYTVVRLAVTEILKGSLTEWKVLIKQIGGVVGDTGLYIPGVAEFSMGEEVAVYLIPRNDGYYAVTGFASGKFNITTAGSQAILSRNMDEVTHIEPRGGKPFSPVEIMTFEDLKALIASTPDKSAQRATPHAPSRTDSDQYRQDMDAQSPAGPVPRTIMSPHYRYFGDTLPTDLYVNPANNPLGDDNQATASAQEGLNVWNSDMTSTIVNYGGTTTDVGGAGNATKTISFNDPTDDIPDPVSCSGTLAMGGSSISLNIMTVYGTTFYQATGGHITFNKGWTTAEGCGYLDNYSNLREIIAHEAGHVIGLGHSTYEGVLMSRSPAFNGSAPTLSQDDRDVLYSIYGELAPSDTTPPTTTATTGGIFNADQSILSFLACEDTGGSTCYNSYYCVGAVGSNCTPDVIWDTEFGSISITESSELRFYSTDYAGNSETVNTETYTITESIAGVTAIAGGGFHGLALKSDETVWSWGYNSRGQLGNGTTTRSNISVRVSGLSGVTAIAGGAAHSLALKNDGTVWAWGYNSRGQLGDGTTSDSSTPVQVSGLTGVSAIAAGENHSLALKSDGTVWAWGYNSRGQLGDGTTTNSSSSVQVSGLTGITAVVGGYNHSLALKSDGTVWAWGYNSRGQLGDGTTTDSSTPVQVSGLTNVTAIAAGENHSLALKSDGIVWAWGSNAYGQLGDGTTTDSNTPVRVSGLTDVTAVATGENHSLALKNDGTIRAWGYNNYGQLGDDTTANSSTPVQVSGLTGVTAVAGGYAHSLALKSDGTVWTWGYNYDGQLGDGTNTNRYTPVWVAYVDDTTSPTTTVSPTGGTYTSEQSVTLACDDEQSGCATTYYTDDGSTPTIGSSQYSTPITISSSATLQYFSVDKNGNTETVKSTSYTIVVPIPTLSEIGMIVLVILMIAVALRRRMGMAKNGWIQGRY